MWKSKSEWGWCVDGAYFLAKFHAGGADSGGAYKKACIVNQETTLDSLLVYFFRLYRKYGFFLFC